MTRERDGRFEQCVRRPPPLRAERKRESETNTRDRPARLSSRHSRGEPPAVARTHSSSSNSSRSSLFSSARSAGHHAYVHARMHTGANGWTDAHERIKAHRRGHARARAYAAASAGCSFVLQSRT